MARSHVLRAGASAAAAALVVVGGIAVARSGSSSDRLTPSTASAPRESSRPSAPKYVPTYLPETYMRVLDAPSASGSISVFGKNGERGADYLVVSSSLMDASTLREAAALRGAAHRRHRGHDAYLSLNNGEGSLSLMWQERSGVTVTVTVRGLSESELIRIADSLKEES